MNKNQDSESFLKAREKLSSALNELEKTIFEKLEETKKNASHNIADDLDSQKLIKNLNSEINHLQKTLSEIGLENEVLKSQIGKSAKKFDHLKNSFADLKQNIKFDLEKLKLIINQNSQKNADH